MSLPPASAGPALPEDDIVLAAEYALGLLEGGARVVFERRLASEPLLRSEVAHWEGRFATLADEVTEVSPRDEIKRRIEARIFGMPGAEPRRARGVLPWTAAALAAAVAAVAVFLAWQPAPTLAPAPNFYVAEIESEGDPLRVFAAFDATEGTIRLERIAGGAAAGRTLELWAIADGADPVSLGLLPDTGALPLPVSLRDDLSTLTLAISEEPEGGSPTGAPTGPVRATGTFVEL